MAGWSGRRIAPVPQGTGVLGGDGSDQGQEREGDRENGPPVWADPRRPRDPWPRFGDIPAHGVTLGAMRRRRICTFMHRSGAGPDRGGHRANGGPGR